MTRFRVALRVPVGRPLPDIADFVARCEGAGFDGVGIHDHPSSGRDAYLALALAARATQRIGCSLPPRAPWFAIHWSWPRSPTAWKK